MTIKYLYNAFRRCLNLNYTTVENDASFYYERNAGTLRIFFEPSNSKKDWISNFDFPAKPYRDMKDKWRCHRGFLKVWKSAEPYLKEQIMDPTVRKIDIAGYSHGGAIALLCHEYVKFNRPDVELRSVGYAAPRALWGFPNKNVMSRFEGFLTIRNWNDIVTKVPPKWLGYRQAGDLMIVKIGKRTGCIKSHYPQGYLASLKEISE